VTKAAHDGLLGGPPAPESGGRDKDGQGTARFLHRPSAADTFSKTRTDGASRHPEPQPTDASRSARLDPARVVVAVPEADADLVEAGAEAKVTVQALPGPDLSGTVTRTSWSLEPGSRTLRTEIDLPNKDHRLRPGMYVYAHIVGRASEGWRLPVAAVAKQGDALVCFLIEKDGEGHKAVRTPVQLGRSDGKFVEVRKRQKPGSPPVWEDFTEADLVAARASGLTDGQAIQPEEAKE
jgi:multidrug efflux pump subunit AcrA (membrane-fusion protein)